EILVGIHSEVLEQEPAADLVRAADAGDADDAPFQLFDALDRRLSNQTEERRLDAVRERAHRRAARCRADRRAENFDVVDIATEQRSDIDRGARLNDLGVETVTRVKAAVLRDEGGEERQ